MLGEFLTNFLVLLFGYAIPAFECFGTVEQRPGRIEELRFWCEYWIIVVILVIFENVANALVSRVPMYGEVKLAFLVYLWYPKTKGTDVVYETFLRPLVMQYEPNIEERLQYLRANAGKLVVFYLKNFTERGYALFLQVLDYVASQTSRVSSSRSFFSFRQRDRPDRAEFQDDYIATDDRRNVARQRRPRSDY